MSNIYLFVRSSIPYEGWLKHCQQTKVLADNELSDVYSFRENMNVIRERARNDIKAQQDVTDFTLRKRIYQTQKARNEIEWQKLKVIMIIITNKMIVTVQCIPTSDHVIYRFKKRWKFCKKN